MVPGLNSPYREPSHPTRGVLLLLSTVLVWTTAHRNGRVHGKRESGQSNLTDSLFFTGSLNLSSVSQPQLWFRILVPTTGSFTWDPDPVYPCRSDTNHRFRFGAAKLDFCHALSPRFSWHLVT